jgi:hypothetical protein
MKKYYVESRRKGISYKQYKKDKWIGHNLCGNCLIKHVIQGNIYGRVHKEEDVSS